MEMNSVQCPGNHSNNPDMLMSDSPDYINTRPYMALNSLQALYSSANTNTAMHNSVPYYNNTSTNTSYYSDRDINAETVNSAPYYINTSTHTPYYANMNINTAGNSSESYYSNANSNGAAHSSVPYYTSPNAWTAAAGFAKSSTSNPYMSMNGSPSYYTTTDSNGLGSYYYISTSPKMVVNNSSDYRYTSPQFSSQYAPSPTMCVSANGPYSNGSVHTVRPPNHTTSRYVPYHMPQVQSRPSDTLLSYSSGLAAHQNNAHYQAAKQVKLEPGTAGTAYACNQEYQTGPSISGVQDDRFMYQGCVKEEEKYVNCDRLDIKEELVGDSLNIARVTHDYLQPDATRSIAEQFLEIENRLCASLSQLTFPEPVTHVYNPLIHASEPHRKFVLKYGDSHKRVLFLGMNPGPFGMAQTGVPFGVTSLVRDWLEIEGKVEKPPLEHPKRPVKGFDCTRKEVSGSRFWGYFLKKCGEPQVFFRNCFVYNICPLVFMNGTGKNITPPQLPSKIRNPLNTLCDQAFLNIIDLLRVDMVVGIGKYGMDRAKRALQGSSFAGIRVETILHPSPANPAANKGWEEVIERQLTEIGILPLIVGHEQK